MLWIFFWSIFLIKTNRLFHLILSTKSVFSCKIIFPLSNKNKLRIPSTGVDSTAPFSGRAYGHGHSGSGYGGGGYGGYGGGGGGYGNDQLVLLRPPVQDDGGALNGLMI